MMSKKSTTRREQELKGTRYQIFEDVYSNKLQPVLTAQIISGAFNDNVSVMTAPTMAASTSNV
jgi:hypothetical protein